MNHDLLVAMYRRLLWLYPAKFRREYGVHMVQTFRDCLRDTTTPAAAMRLWWSSLADLLINAGAERLRQMSDPSWLIERFWFITGLFALIVSSGVLFWTVWGITVVLLIPWDVGNPPPGTFAKAVNDFFESDSPYSAQLLAMIVFFGDALTLMITILRRESRSSVVFWRFTRVHLVTSVIAAVIAAAGMWAASLMFPVYDVWQGDQSRGTAYIYWGLIVTGGLIAFYVVRAWSALFAPKLKGSYRRVAGQ